MLIRVRGAKSGIKKYLEDGQKEGREFSRNELDERVILAGDLELTDSIINSIGRDGEAYLHITMSFREDEISPEMLKAITQEFKKFAFAAYREDEFDLYAEAHIPKIKSYVHKRTGELVERKPHIHFVIPEMNLLSGQILNPFGKLDKNTKFLEAFQEHINNKFGLASPKDHRRIELTDASEMISRYKGDVFSGANADLKNKILDAVMSRGIRDYEVFKEMLTEFGATRTRNKGKETEYQNVKLEGAPKGVNLNAFVFSREFIELDAQAKRARLAAEAGGEYETAKKPRPSDRKIHETLTEWHEVRSREIKYLNSGNVKAFRAYKEADQATRRAMLAERETNFYSKHSKDDHDQQHRSKQSGRDPYARAYPYKRQPGVKRGKSHTQSDRSLAATQSLNRVRSLSGVGVVRFGEGSEVLLPGDARHQLEHEGAERSDALRRGGDRATAGGLNGRDVDNVVGQLAHEARERKALQLADRQPEMAEIKRTLDARRLLDHLSHSHGLKPEKYTITKGKDGGDRIQCGTRNLNVSDFLTEHMRLPWETEAKKILQDCYAAQRGNLVEHARSKPRRELWEQYRSEGKPAQELKRKAEWDAQRASETERFAKIKDVFAAQKGRIEGDRSMSAVERRAAISVARMQRVQAEQALRETKGIERDNLKASQRKPYSEQYRDWLTAQAEAGNVAALGELRRMRRERSKPLSNLDAHIKAPAAVPERVAIHHVPNITYQVHRNGDVTYQRDGLDVLRDAGRTVQMLQQDTQSIETGLRLAMAKFGSTLVLSGPQEFQERTARLAAELGLRVGFSDPRLNTIMDARRAELEAERVQAAEARKMSRKPQQQAEPEIARLVAHGPAPYLHDKKNKTSYFVDLADRDGNIKTVWGVDLPRSLAKAGAVIGHEISLERGGHELVQVPVLDKAGRPVIKDGEPEMQSVERAVWVTTIHTMQAQAVPPVIEEATPPAKPMPAPEEPMKEQTATEAVELDKETKEAEPVEVEQGGEDDPVSVLSKDLDLDAASGRPVLAEAKQWDRHVGFIVGISKTHIAVAENDRTTIHEIEGMRITSDGKVHGQAALAKGNSIRLLYKSERGKTYGQAFITEKRHELQHQRSRGLGD